jgi:hypothetical protein
VVLALPLAIFPRVRYLGRRELVLLRFEQQPGFVDTPTGFSTAVS